MSNYPNMSYCMCENTALALKQVLNEMQNYDSVAEFTADMGREEKQAFIRLFDLCEQFMIVKEEMEQFDEYYNEGGETDDAYALASAGFGTDEDY